VTPKGRFLRRLCGKRNRVRNVLVMYGIDRDRNRFYGDNGSSGLR
jgi:hypothetical protein